MDEQESRRDALVALYILEVPAGTAGHVLDAARAQGEVMTLVPGHGNVRVEYQEGVYTVTS